MSLTINSLYRYNVRDPANPLLNENYKIDSYSEKKKDVLTFKGAGLTSVDLPIVLNNSTIYIAECDGEPEGEYDVGENITPKEISILGVTILAYNKIKPESGGPYKITITCRQPIKLEGNEVLDI